MEWLTKRRDEMGLTLDDLARELQLMGFSFSPGAISHWEKGRHKPKLMTDPLFRKALAQILRMDVHTMLRLDGYEVDEEEFSPQAEQAAYLINQMPPDKQELALRLIEQLARPG